jgi:hypothetical protein
VCLFFPEIQFLPKCVVVLLEALCVAYWRSVMSHRLIFYCAGFKIEVVMRSEYNKEYPSEDEMAVYQNIAHLIVHELTSQNDSSEFGEHHRSD